MKEYKKIIDEEVVNQIQLKDAEVQTRKAVITSLLEMHMLDKSSALIESPVFIAYQKALRNAEIEFNKAKDEMITSIFDFSERQKITNWNLDYNTCVLSYIIKE